jgi:NADH dehydrogenase FAD-containing subunit
MVGKAVDRPFRYRDEGALATIGRSAAIVKLEGLEPRRPGAI